MRNDPRPPAGEQPEELPRPDTSPDGPGAEPVPAATIGPEQDPDDECYDPEHFEDL